MRFLITGADGQLGKEWAAFCRKHNIEHAGFGSAGLDITNTADIERAAKDLHPDVIVNCAAYTKVDAAETEQETAYRINATALEFLSGFCKKNNIKLIHYSTDYVFEGSAGHRKELPDGYPEDFETRPMNIYGKSKLAGEEFIRASGCEHLIIRTSWLCGQYGGNFVKTMLRLAESGKELKVVNDQFGSPGFAANVVHNTYVLIQAGASGTFHISSAGICSWYDFAIEIFKQKGLHVSVKPVSSSEFPAAAKRPAFSKLNTEKMAKIEGALIESWQDGLKKLLRQI